MPDEKLRRWRLVLGREGDPEGTSEPEGEDLKMDEVLEALYDEGVESNLSQSVPHVNRWLGDIRKYFPRPVVEILQKDAFERLDIKRMLLEPELLNTVEHNADLVATLLSLSKILPEETKETARKVIQNVVRKLEAEIRIKLVQAVNGAIKEFSQTKSPKFSEIDWNQTINRNLKHYQPQLKTLIPDLFTIQRKKRASIKHVQILLDQSGSMAGSVVHAGIMSSVLSRIPSFNTQVFAFDTGVADLTPFLDDPVELLMGTQLGGGTDILNAINYAAERTIEPGKTLVFLISDLHDTVDEDALLNRMLEWKQTGVKLINLLALSNDGKPSHNRNLANQMASSGIPSLYCTPNEFPILLKQLLSQRSN